MNQLKQKRSQINNDRNRRRRRPKPRSRGAVYGAAFSQLRNDVNMLRKFINTETKYVDTTRALSATIAGYQSLLLNGILQGTTSSTRTGQSVKCTGLEFRARIARDPLSVVVEEAVRIIIFRDKAANATGPTISDVFPASTTSLRSVAYLDRFVVLFDDACTLSLNGDGSKFMSFSMAQNWHQEFNTGNAGTIADITVNSLYFAVTTESAATFPLVAYTFRYCFVDN